MLVVIEIWNDLEFIIIYCIWIVVDCSNKLSHSSKYFNSKREACVIFSNFRFIEFNF